LLLAADAFAAALEAVPAEDWCRTWAAGRTIMLRRTSKRVKEAVDKMLLPAVVRLRKRFEIIQQWFWDDSACANVSRLFRTERFWNDAERERVLRQLEEMKAWSASPHSSCRDLK
jgi:hypothetical protein